MHVPVVRNSYSLLPPATKPTAEKPDPFADVPVVEDTIGGVPATAADPITDESGATATETVTEDTVGAVPPDMVDPVEGAPAEPADVPLPAPADVTEEAPYMTMATSSAAGATRRLAAAPVQSLADTSAAATVSAPTEAAS